MDFNAIYAGLVDHPTACLLAVALFVIGYLYKARNDDTKEHMAALASQSSAHLETVERIVPLAEKLIQSVDMLERVTRAAGKE